jgi:hypothetical protein
MNKMKFFLAAVAVALVRLFTGQVAEAEAGCVTCNMYQQCELGGSYDHCEIFEYDGQLWCNMVGECTAMAPSPLDVSPAGTYFASTTVTSPEQGIAVSACGGFVVAHFDPAKEDPGWKAASIRI